MPPGGRTNRQQQRKCIYMWRVHILESLTFNVCVTWYSFKKIFTEESKISHKYMCIHTNTLLGICVHITLIFNISLHVIVITKYLLDCYTNIPHFKYELWTTEGRNINPVLRSLCVNAWTRADVGSGRRKVFHYIHNSQSKYWYCIRWHKAGISLVLADLTGVLQDNCQE